MLAERSVCAYVHSTNKHNDMSVQEKRRHCETEESLKKSKEEAGSRSRDTGAERARRQDREGF